MEYSSRKLNRIRVYLEWVQGVWIMFPEGLQYLDLMPLLARYDVASVDKLLLFPIPNGHNVSSRCAAIHSTTSLAPDTNASLGEPYVQIPLGKYMGGEGEGQKGQSHQHECEGSYGHIGHFDPAVVSKEGQTKRREESGQGV